MLLKLLKFSPRRDAIFDKLKKKQEITPNVLGLRTLSPTHWTIRAASLESIHLNYPMHTNGNLGRSITCGINSVAAKMSDFAFHFRLMLAELLLRHCDNLNETIQCSSMPAIEVHSLSELCIKVLQKM